MGAPEDALDTERGHPEPQASPPRGRTVDAHGIPTPIQYELRIGVSGHRDLGEPEAVEQVVRELVRGILHTLQSASAEPLGPHGSPQSIADRFDRGLTRVLALASQAIGPVFDALVRAIRRGLGRSVPDRGSNDPSWPRVPPVIDAPAPGRQTPLKLTVISALATGADQAVARAVCSMVDRPDYRNRYLEAVLPFSQRVYEEDFTNAADLQAFRDLLALDRGRENTHPDPTVLCPDFPVCPDPMNPSVPLSRDKAYAAAGRYVVESSEILIAVWDPSREEKPGGTAQTVRYAIDRGRLVLWIDPAALDAGPFLLTREDVDPETGGDPARARRRWWQAGSRRDSAAAPAPIDGRIHAPRGFRAHAIPTRAKHLSRNFHRLAAYNRDPAVHEPRLRQELIAETDRLVGLTRAAGLPELAARTLINDLLPHVVRAEHLSTRYRRLRELAARLWPSAAALVVTLMAFQIIFLPDWYWLAVIELTVLLLGYVSHRVSLYGAWHEKWLNDRRLADGLRAAAYTALVLSDDDLTAERGMAFTSPGVSRHLHDPLPFYDPVNTWFVATVKRVLRKERRTFAAALTFDEPVHRAAVRRLLSDGWIRPEIDAHRRGARRRQRAIVRSGRIRLGMILALMAIATLHAFGIGHGDHGGVAAPGRPDLWIAFATIALPAWAAAFHVMLSLDDGARRAERSALMASLLRGLRDRLEEADSLPELRECVAEAERIMDLESREWAESLVERKPEFTG